MGLFKSMRDLTKAANDIERTNPSVSDQMAAAVTSIQHAQAAMASLADASALEAELRASGVPATGTVAAVTGDQGYLNGSPILLLELTAQVAGRPLVPATTRAAVPVHLVHRVSVGATVPLLADATATRFTLDLVALATS